MSVQPTRSHALPMPRVPTQQEATRVNAMIITMVMVWCVPHVVATLALQQAVQTRVPVCARTGTAVMLLLAVKTSMNATLASTLATRTVYALTLMVATTALALPTSTGTGLPAQPVGHTRLPRVAAWMPPPARVTSATLVIPPSGVQTRTSVRLAATLLRRARTPPGAFLANARRTTTGTG
eukprot:Rmarinus@m.5290